MQRYPGVLPLLPLKAFGSPLSYVVEANQSGDRTLSGGAIRHGVLALGTEMGGAGHVTRAAVRIAERGVNNILVHLGILPESTRIAPDAPQRFLEVGGGDYYVYAPENGLYEPLVDLGDMVEAGQPAARIHFPETPWAEPATAHFARAGFVLCKRIPGAHDAGRLSVPSRNRRGALGSPDAGQLMCCLPAA
jgi:uncharacterized protein